MRDNRRLLAAAGFSFLMAVPAAAAPCTSIAAVPFTITSAGSYCLASSMTTNITTGAAIEVAADDVTLDLGGFTLEGIGGGRSLANGIHSMNRRAIVVRNGTVKGFLIGILIDADSVVASRDHIVEKVTVRDCYYEGIQMEGSAMILRDSVVKDIGGPTGHHPNGVEVCANGMFGSIEAYNNVIDNVFGTSAEQSPDGMMLECVNSIAIGNRISRVDDQILSVRSGVCRDNVLQMVAQRPFEAIKGAPGCTLLGKSNFVYP
jgi:hypothetical protein